MVEQLEALYRDRPAVVDADNGAVWLQALVARTDAEARGARGEGVAAVAGCSDAPTCARALQDHPGAMTQWARSEPWLMDGYRDVLAAPGWREEVPEYSAMELPAYQPLLDGQKLHLLQARRLAGTGDVAGVRARLQADFAFWRRMMASSDLLVGKMVAVAGAKRSLALGTWVLAGLPAEQAEAGVPPAWREPLTVPERSLRRAFAGEWRFSAGAMRSLAEGRVADSPDGLDERLARPLLQAQATLNLSAARMARLGELSEVSYEAMEDAIGRVAATPSEPGFQLYNPVGAILDAIAHPDLYTGYVARTADVEGVRRAALLVAALRSAGTASEAVPAALEASTLRNPYSGGPFGWDAGDGAVVFDGLEEGERGRHALPL